MDTNFVQKYYEAIVNNEAAVFVGAGLSISAGAVDWTLLLKDTAASIGLDSTREMCDLPALAQYFVNEKGSRQELTDLISANFKDIHAIDQNHILLAQLPIHTYWTTNYDQLIEDSLNQEKKKFDVKVTEESIYTSSFGCDATVYKMHGDVSSPEDTILTKEEYEFYAEKHPLMLNALNRDLISKTFLFLGFSFADENLQQILKYLKVWYARCNGKMKTHYCIMRKPKRGKDERTEDFEYRKIHESLFCKDLNRFGIEIVWIDDFSEITEILQSIKRLYYKKTIFISGAIADYGTFDKEVVNQFVYKLSGALVKAGYRLVTGYGWGIGNYVIGGALNEVYMNRGKILEDELIARPFPQGDAEIKKKWSEYRRDMISYTGVSIFMFGNKKGEDGTIINSPGMQEEYDISENLGNILVPIAATEYKSRELWEQLINNHGGEDIYRRFRADFETLAQKNGLDTPDILIDSVLNIVTNA